jgi:VWFA-related protein
MLRRSQLASAALFTLLASLLSLSLFANAQVPVQSSAPPAPPQAPPPQRETTIKVNTEIVLVNVIARDKKGNLIRDLKREDFTVSEDGKKQDISSFDFENVDELALAAKQGTIVTGANPTGPVDANSPVPAAIDARDRRLILMFFDFSAMEPDEIDRAVDSAKKYVNTAMQPADLVALVSLATDLKVDVDYTDNKTKLLAQLSAYNSSEGQGFENGATGSAEGGAETSGSYTPDDTDYNTFSADRKLLALQSVMKSLAMIPQKKSLIYFSNGISQSGVDNQTALRAATAAAVRANVSIYPVDVRGLQSFPPGGQAQSASIHGTSAYSGASVLNDLNSNASSQETLYTLAADTGGKPFMDTNDFSGVFSQVQKDSSAYYVLGYTSTNHLKDGRFRRLKVTINRQDVKLEYRPGYYAGRDYSHMNRTDREEALEDELSQQLPSTDIAVYAGASYFRQDDSHYYLGISLVIPGSQIPFVQAKDKDSARWTSSASSSKTAKPRFPLAASETP